MAKRKKSVNPFKNTSQSTFVDNVRTLVTRYGSQKGLASQLGVSDRTIRNWLSYKMPKPEHVKRVNRSAGQVKRQIANANKAVVLGIREWLNQNFSPDELDNWTRQSILEIADKNNLLYAVYYRQNPSEAQFITPDHLLNNEWYGKQTSDKVIHLIGTVLQYPKYLYQSSALLHRDLMNYRTQKWDLNQTLINARNFFFNGEWKDLADNLSYIGHKEVPERFIAYYIKRRQHPYNIRSV